MLRFIVERSAPLLALTWILSPAVSCTWTDGNPWAEAQLSMSARIDVPRDRQGEDGRIKTVKDYEVEVERFEIQLGEVRFVVGETPQASSGFDPANPPAGYSLCHNGHCHDDQGNLVDYEDIARTLGVPSAAEVIVRQPVGSEPLLLDDDWQDVALQACIGSCDLSLGTLTRVELDVLAVTAQGVAFDRRAGTARRLPAEGVPWQVEVQTPGVLTAPLDLEITSAGPLLLELDGQLQLLASFWDDLDFQQLEGDGGSGSPWEDNSEIAALIGARILESSWQISRRNAR
jgi:hypothetical protein